MTEQPFSDAAGRNSIPILEVLRHEFATVRTVLEIGSGTGQHAVFFARAMPQLNWRSSDRAENLRAINARFDSAGLGNLRSPLRIDVLEDDVPGNFYDAVYSSNTAHIMSWNAVERMFYLVAKALSPSGKFCLYGPFRQRGVFNSTSNAEFHRSLRARDSTMGIRHLESLDAVALANGFYRKRLYSMPANNHLAVWQGREG